MVRETDELYGGILKRMLGSNIVKMGKEGWDQLNSSCLLIFLIGKLWLIEDFKFTKNAQNVGRKLLAMAC